MKKFKQRKRAQEIIFRAVFFTLMIALLFLSGCSDLSGKEKEIYLFGKIIHNPNFAQGEVLAPDFNNSAVYNFSFNFPGYSPEYYTSLLWFIHPFQWGAGGANLPVGSPLSQTIYAYVDNPASENYPQKFLFSREVNLNYLLADSECGQFALESASMEKICTGVFSEDCLKPELKEKKEFNFGSSYIPGSVYLDLTSGDISYPLLRLKNKLIGIRGGAFLQKYLEVAAECSNPDGTRQRVSYSLEKPFYKLYENNNRILIRNLTDYSGSWNSRELDYPLTYGKNYLFIMEIPTHYPLFNRTIVTSNFSLKSGDSDLQIPSLEDLEISPKFKPGVAQTIKFRASDDVLRRINVNAFYKNETSAWMPISISFNTSTGLASGSFIPRGNSISLKILLKDHSGKTQQYEIYPVSLKEINAELRLESLPVNMTPGDTIDLTGCAFENGTDKKISGLLVDILLDNTILNREITRYNDLTFFEQVILEKGCFRYTYQVPANYTGPLNFAVKTYDAGVYRNFSKNLVGQSASFNHDVRVLSLKFPNVINIGENNTLKTVIANVGNSTENIGVVLEEISYGSYAQKTLLLFNQTITMDKLTSKELSINFTGKAGGRKYLIQANITGDSNPGNNILESEIISLRANYDASPYISCPYFLAINNSDVNLYFSNDGLKDINNVSYWLDYSEDCFYDNPEAIEENCAFSNFQTGIINKIPYRGFVQKAANISKLGSLKLRLRLNSSSDQNPENDFAYTSVLVRPSGSDLQLYMFSEDSFIFNQSKNLTLSIYNSGNFYSRNTTFFAYTSESYCQYINTCEKTLILSNRLSDLPTNEVVDYSFEFTPDKMGWNYLILFVNSTNEIYPENNFLNFGYFAKLPGPDASVYFEYPDIEHLPVFNESGNIALNVENLGTDSGNINLSLYWVNDASEVFIQSLLLNNMAPKEFRQANISWRPPKSGEVILLAKVAVANDSYEGNNEQSAKFTVLRRGVEVVLESIHFPKINLLGKSSYFGAVVRNYGTNNSKNVNLSFYINQNLSQSWNLGLLEPNSYDYKYIEWTPSIKGNHTLRAVANTSEDRDYSNNALNGVASVIGTKNIPVYISDFSGNGVRRVIGFGAPIYEHFYIDMNKSFSLDTPDSFFESNVQIIDFVLGEEYGAAMASNILYPVEDMSIVSEFYNKTRERDQDYWMVFANQLSFSRNVTYFEMFFPLSYTTSIGKTFNENDTIFYCESFNFFNRTCNHLWQEANLVFINSRTPGESIMAGAYIERPAEAFAISQMRGYFDGETSAFSSLNLSVPQRIILERSRYGKIEFLDSIDFSRYQGNNNELEGDFRKYVLISEKNIYIDTSAFELIKNKSAKITFNGVNLRNPKVLYNGQSCPSNICRNYSYNSTTKALEVVVSRFSEFNVIEGSYCGDGICDSSLGESCSSCSGDCSCGPRGSGSAPTCTPNWNCSWTPCLNGQKSYLCIKTNTCLGNAGKPQEIFAQTCFISRVCADSDGDGYGVGADCLGTDSNDRDPSVHALVISPADTNAPIYLPSDTGKYLLLAIMLILGILILAILIALLIKLNRPKPLSEIMWKKPNSSEDFEKKAEEKNTLKLIQAREIVADARLKGYTDSEIRKKFEDYGWNQDQLDRIMY